MAQLQAQLKRGILDEIWYQAKSVASSLEVAIRGFKSVRFDDIKRGTFVSSTSGGGHSVTFHIPELFRQLGPDQFFMLGQEFLDLFATVTANQTAAGLPTDDDSLFAAMMASDQMQTVTGVMVDTTSLRWPTYGPSR